MTMATLAICGAPLFSGFFSKDEILWRAYSSSFGGWGFWIVGLFTAGLTAFYMFRLWFLTFFGEYRGAVEHHHEAPGREKHAHEGHIHESPKVMLVPLVILAVLSVAGGWIGVPQVMGGSNHFEHYLAPVFETQAAPSAEHSAGTQEARATHSSSEELALSLAATGTALLGFFLAWLFYYKKPELPAVAAQKLGAFYRLLDHKYYVDEIYAAAIVKPIVAGSTYFLWKAIDAGVIDGTINAAARAATDTSNVFRRMQSGNIRSYAGWVALGAACVIAYMAWLGVR